MRLLDLSEFIGDRQKILDKIWKKKIEQNLFGNNIDFIQSIFY